MPSKHAEVWRFDDREELHECLELPAVFNRGLKRQDEWKHLPKDASPLRGPFDPWLDALQLDNEVDEAFYRMTGRYV